MAEHVHKIEDDRREVAVLPLVEVLQQLLARLQVGDLVVSPVTREAPAPQLRPEKVGLVRILRSWGLLVFPPLRVHLCNPRGRHAGEHGVSRVLRGRGEETPMHPLGIHLPPFIEQWRQHPPLVIAEIVNDDQ